MPGTLVKPQSPSIATPVPDDADAERMHKYITDRRVIGIRPPAKLTRLLALKSGYSPSPSPTARSALARKLAAIPPHVSKTSTPAPPLSDVQYDPLIQPALIRHEITSTPESQSTIARARWTASRINAGEDAIDLLVYRGLASIRPGSPHDYRY